MPIAAARNLAAGPGRPVVARPHANKVPFASVSAGNSSHIAGVILKKRGGRDRVPVRANGTPPAVQTRVGGQVHGAYLTPLAVKRHVDGGKLPPGLPPELSDFNGDTS